MLFLALLRKTLTDSVLVASREGRINQLSQPRVAWMRFNVRAFFDGRNDVISNTDIQLGIDALAVKVHGHRHYVHVACALAVAEERPFDAVGACQ